MDVDMIGFNRGASQARDFANQIVSHTKNGIYQYFTRNDANGQPCANDSQIAGMIDMASYSAWLNNMGVHVTSTNPPPGTQLCQ